MIEILLSNTEIERISVYGYDYGWDWEMDGAWMVGWMAGWEVLFVYFTLMVWSVHK